MSTLSEGHITSSAPVLLAPFIVLLLASIHALVDNDGLPARNAVTLIKSTFCGAVLALAAVMAAGDFELPLIEADKPEWSLHFGLLSTALLVIVSFTSLVIAKGTVRSNVANTSKGNIARWNVAVLFSVMAMILSGNMSALVIGCFIAAVGVLKVYATAPGILPALTSGGMNASA